MVSYSSVLAVAMIRMCLLPAHIRKLSDWLLFTGRFKSLRRSEIVLGDSTPQLPRNARFETFEAALHAEPVRVCETHKPREMQEAPKT